uniref:Uncharacterized protein n=1 Tax=Myotis myotis TaxID=51298 RepID=A0A7J7VIS5_MYOMY|nr:hypothetical protein mMyoMyo1_008371 [Myotis myotis]
MPPLVTLRVGPIGGLGHCPLSHSRQGRWGGCGTTPCHAQSRAHQGVGELPPVTHRVEPIGELGHCPLSHTEQGRSGGWGAATVTLRAGPMGRLWFYPVTHRAGPLGRGGWGATPCHTQSRRAIRGLGWSPLSGTEQG